jgi:hypothetical protein
MFCHIMQNWRGCPLLTHDVIISLIANTTTQAGLTIQAALDKQTHPLGVEFTKAEFSTLKIKPATFHGDWNYVIAPRLSD